MDSVYRLFFLVFLVSITSCGSDSVPVSDPVLDPVPDSNTSINTYSIGGRISGLTGTVILINNGNEELIVHSDGNATSSFVFSTQVDDGSNYHVTIASQSVTQACSIDGGSGTVTSSDISLIDISCVDTNIERYGILGGTFILPSGSTQVEILAPGDNNGTLVAGTFQGEPDPLLGLFGCSTDALFDPFNFFDKPVCTYTARTGVDNVIHPAPIIDLANGTADMSSFYVNWNGTEFYQGSENVQVTNNFDGTYTIAWIAVATAGPKDSTSAEWTMIISPL
ncbi:MAG: hypothetical protein QM500_05170 [Methylococcales bacterium]